MKSRFDILGQSLTLAVGIPLAVAVVGLGNVLVPTTAHAQSLTKDSVVMLRPPQEVFSSRPKKILGAVGGTEYFATVEVSGGHVLVEGKSDWQATAFPWMAEMRVGGLEFKKDRQLWELELKGPKRSGYWVKLYLKGDPKVLAPAILASPEQSQAVIEEAYAALAPRVFTGPWAEISSVQQKSILSFMQGEARAVRLGSANYKENMYLVVALGSDGTEYNDLKLNQAQRIGLAMNERILSVMKGFAKAAEGVENIYGVKLEFNLQHRDFLATAVPSVDKVQLYAPLAALRKFLDADITSQQLIDSAVLIVNDNRIQVSLAGQ